MTVITCVHQGFELYGSDRAFVETVRLIRSRHRGAAIAVVLPRRGPIVDALSPLDVDVIVEPLWILRRRDLPWLATVGMTRLPAAVGRALARIRRSDLVYVNTCVVADYLLAAGLCPGRTVLHIHEIPQGAVLAALRALVRWSRASVIFNSRATERCFALPAAARGRVIYNRIADPGGCATPPARNGRDPLRILMLGRISRIKGQDVLLDALRRLPDVLRSRVELRIVGNAYEDDARERALAEAVSAAGLSGRVALLPFAADPGPHFHWADIVAVPSRLPESLGRVAIEAMAHGKPPVVSDIGGLPEIVEHGRSGWIVPPGDAAALAATLAGIVADPEPWRSFGAAARGRYEAVFGGGAIDDAMMDALGAVLDRSAASTCTPLAACP